jgi:hypothetical protein
MEIKRVTTTKKFKENPFLEEGVLTIKKGRSTVIAGRTKKVMLDVETGEAEGLVLLHKYKEVDKDQFIKLYLGEIRSLFDLSKTGLKAFGYVISCMRINDAEIYLNVTAMTEFCQWTATVQAYKGLGELIANKIIAPSVQPNLWFINPNVIFNGDRIAFIKEYRLKQTKKIGASQGFLFPPPAPEGEQV